MEDFTDWLGPAADDLTDEQRDEFDTAADRYWTATQPPADPESREPVYRDAGQDDAVLSAILQTVLGEDDVEKAGNRLARAKAETDAFVIAAAHLGMPRREIARKSGYSLVTVQNRLGKHSWT